jgi:hypothetical protein
VERKQAESESRDERYKNDQITLNRRLVYATVALVFATIVTGVIGGIQLWYVHRQWKLSSDGLSKMGDQIWAAKNAAYASEKAAKAASDSADTQGRTMRLDERPWINIIVGNAVLQDQTPIKMPIRIVNTGKTPAFKVHGLVAINLLEEKDRPDFTYIRGHPKFSISSGTIIPNSPNDLSWPVLPKYVPKDKPITEILTTKEIRTGIQDGSLYIVVHAKVTYDDIFRVHHWINFCAYAHNVAGLPEKPTGDTCGAYNDVDKNVEEQQTKDRPKSGRDTTN